MLASRRRRAAVVIRWASLVLIVAGILLLLRLLPVSRGIASLADWIDALGLLGPAVFGLIYVLATLLFVPGVALTLMAGAVFGAAQGVVIVSLASTSAAGLACFATRHLVRSRIERLARKHTKFGAIDRAIGRGGWRIVALLRLSPAVPFSASNYLYGLTSVRFWPYVFASWLAMLPGTFLYVSLGHAGATGLRAAGAQQGHDRGVGEWSLLVSGILATILVTVYITRLARRALREQALLERAGGSGVSPPPSPNPPAARAARVRGSETPGSQDSDR